MQILSDRTPENDSACLPYYLGIDGGGSKTLAVVVDEQGRECGRGLAGSSNYAAIGLEMAMSNIQRALEQATATLAIPTSTQAEQICFRRAWLGMAGMDRPDDDALLWPRLRGLAQFVHITNDADLLLSAFEDTVGIALIAGTGSIALGRNAQGPRARAGGWGHLLGDEGSGYDLGLQALKAVTRAVDGRGPATLLLDLIMSWWQLQSAHDIIGQVYPQEDKAKIARLTPLVFEAADAGDACAIDIIQRSARELADLVGAVGGRLFPDATQKIALALGGGLLLHQQNYQEQVLAAVRQQQALGTVVAVEQPALSAARAMITFQQDTSLQL